jgi:hypothetical protein
MTSPSSLITQRHYISPDGMHELCFTEQSFPSIQQKTTASPLTPDNAATVLGNAFDLSTLTDTMANNPKIIHDQRSLFDLMTKCVIDQTVTGSLCLALYVCPDSPIGCALHQCFQSTSQSPRT